MILGVMTFSKRGQKTAEDLFEKCKEISPLYYDGDMRGRHGSGTSSPITYRFFLWEPRGLPCV